MTYSLKTLIRPIMKDDEPNYYNFTYFYRIILHILSHKMPMIKSYWMPVWEFGTRHCLNSIVACFFRSLLKRNFSRNKSQTVLL